MTSRPSIRTQILVFTLFGDYVLPLGATAWTVGLLKLMELLEVTERGVMKDVNRSMAVLLMTGGRILA